MFINVERRAQKLFNTYQQATSEENMAMVLANPLFSWHATYYTAKRKKNIIFLNDATTMAIVLFDVNAKNKQTIKERFEKQLAIIWQELGLSAESLTDYLATGGDWQIGKTVHPLQIKTITNFYQDVIKPQAKTVVNEVDLAQSLVKKVQQKGRIYVGEGETVKIIEMAQPFNIKHVNLEELYLKEITNKLRRLSQLDGEKLTADGVDNAIQQIQDANNQLLDLFLADAKRNSSTRTIRRYRDNLQFYLNEWVAYRLSTIFNLDIQTSVDELEFHGVGKTERTNIKASLKKLAKYLKNQDILSDNEYDDIIVYTQKDPVDLDEDNDQVIGDFLASLFSESEKLPAVFGPQTDKMLDEYLKSFIALYGLISAQQAYQIIHSQNPTIDKERFEQYIQNKFDEMTMEYCIIDFKEEFKNVDIAPEIFIFSPLLIKDENRLPSFYKHQQGLLYYIPEKEILVDNNFNPFTNISNYQQELEELLANQYGLSGDDLKGAAFLSLYQLKMSDYGLELASVNDAINKVVTFLNEEHGLSVKPDKANEPLIKILALTATNIRRPWNRGWSNYELLRTKNIAKLVSEMEINLEAPKLSSEIISGIQVGKINRDELLDFLENSNLPPKVISKLYKQVEEI
ncbi:hypothetical protein LMB33_04755 [Limosilactobacillus reuteri]|uniref:DUF6933 domain-containing protein n=1 Tax=Limosilactobacillus reuteri TaxID=1598 RepID=UPI001E288954|nr:hypothetical protein [Limosilactobacillus reuteri]MCC4325767.1 hypothetical protein [Limosilactobacillus reuteri]MCC4329680.1 hypothetical protein [Limosilactobacillus reuteri]MCC4352963.1 hypothetical protein [Limosilactobacillus reuteri]MCC4378144.1 hypothetical protein [Limosilactobacillus reuteri]